MFEALQDTYPHVRFEAAEQLASIDSAMPRLVEVATHAGETREVVDSRRAALLGLRRELSDDALEVVVDLTQDSDPIIRYHALLALHENRDRVPLEEICSRALSDDDDDVAIVGAQWAAQHGWKSRVPEVKAAWNRRRKGEVRLQFALALLELDNGSKPDVTPDLIAALKDDRIARPAILAIARSQVADAANGLRQVTRRFWFHVVLRIDAAAALVVLGEEDGDSKLRGFLTDRKEHVSTYACECVGRYQLDSYVPELESLLGSGDDRALAAVVALKKIDSDASRLALQVAIDSKDEKVRAAARA